MNITININTGTSTQTIEVPVNLPTAPVNTCPQCVTVKYPKLFKSLCTAYIPSIAKRLMVDLDVTSSIKKDAYNLRNSINVECSPMSPEFWVTVINVLESKSKAYNKLIKMDGINEQGDQLPLF